MREFLQALSRQKFCKHLHIQTEYKYINRTAYRYVILGIWVIIVTLAPPPPPSLFAFRFSLTFVVAVQLFRNVTGGVHRTVHGVLRGSQALPDSAQ